MSKLPKVKIYTDGSCIKNPKGPGGYGIIMELEGKNYKRYFNKGFRCTTNNRMELLAAVDALKKLRVKCEVTILSDSKYVVNSVSKGWLFLWEQQLFLDRVNDDLWKEFLVEYRKHNVTMVWIKGHNGHPQNDHCDVMAYKAAKGKVLYEDLNE